MEIETTTIFYDAFTRLQEFGRSFKSHYTYQADILEPSYHSLWSSLAVSVLPNNL
jgi:hypothetical protein